MKLSNFTLFFAFAVFSTCLRASDAAKQEPIPDFGPEGPVGYSPREGVSEDLSLNTRRESSQIARGALFSIRSALRQLDLDMKQQIAIRSVVEDYVEQGEQLRSDIERMRDTLQTAQQASGNESVVKSARRAMIQLSGEGRTLHASMVHSISEILTEDQLQQFHAIKDARRKQAAGRPKNLKTVL